jgi:hypothetical protein
LSDLILRSPLFAGVSKDERRGAEPVNSWFETAQERLLTMRPNARHDLN